MGFLLRARELVRSQPCSARTRSENFVLPIPTPEMTDVVRKISEHGVDT